MKQRILSLLLAVCLVAGLIPGAVFAGEDSLQTGGYRFRDHGETLTLEDVYHSDDRWFLEDSTENNIHLANLSASLAVSATPAGSGREEANAEALLKALDFTEIQTNGYYNNPTRDNGVACLAAEKSLGDATLVALVFRGEDYGWEWTGNFNVGGQGPHQGFLAARDEGLRFLRQYIQSHEIQGRIKVWVCGFSRGAATANLVGGFLWETQAASEYLGVTIRPTDVYAYCVATPANMTKGLSRAEVLSVSGSRADYPLDAPGEAYVCTLPGTVDPAAAACVHNYLAQGDPVTALPLEEAWGFTRYGDVTPVTYGSQTMMAWLAKICPPVYEAHAGSGFLSVYEAVATGLTGQEPGVTYTKPELTAQRVAALGKLLPVREDYDASAAPEILSAAAGIYYFGGQTFVEGVTEDTALIGKAAALTYLSYAADMVRGEPGNENLSDGEALNVALERIVYSVTGQEISAGETTLDELVAIAVQFLDENTTLVYDQAGEPVSLTSEHPLLSKVLPEIPAEYMELLAGMLPMLAHGDEEAEMTAAEVRQSILSMLPLLLRYQYNLPHVVEAIGQETTRDQRGVSTTIYGTGRLSGLVEALLVDLLEYPDLATGADQALSQLAAKGSSPAVKDAVEALAENPRMVRSLLTSLLFCPGDRYDPTADVVNALNGAAYVSSMILCHYPEVYISGLKAMDDSYSLSETPAFPPEPPVPGPGLSFPDLEEGAWYQEGVQYVLIQGIMNGEDDGFHPEDDATRAMIVTMLWRLAGEPQSQGDLTFRDVAADQWYTEAVRWAAGEKIVEGYDENRFGPDDKVTREQMAAILYRYAKTQGLGFQGSWSFLLDYPDADKISDYALEGVSWMTMNGLLQGYEDGRLIPGGHATRAEIATLFMRYCKLIEV